jgi:glycosyltransferase involved in cell wall biosynthesis
MLFSIVIPTFNNLEELRGCLNALERIQLRDFEVHVCVDGSTDGTASALQGAGFGYPLFVHEHPGGVNRGRSAARNLSLPHLNGQYTLFLDSDMQAATDLLDQHLAVLSQGNAASIGFVVYRNLHQNLWARYTSERGVGKFSQGQQVPFHYFITPNTAIPTEWFRAVGGFDEAINRYGGEDMELGYRIEQAFHPAFVFNRAAKVFTVQEKPLSAALEQLSEYGRTGLPYIVKKHPALSHIYWVNKVQDQHIGNVLFGLLTKGPFPAIAKGLLAISPYPVKKFLINYLVICAIHAGFRGRLG